ncbi:ATP-binding protein [soil metagenome]
MRMPSAGDVQALNDFMDREVPKPLLGLVYGRRRIGKSTLLVQETRKRRGLYYEAARVDTGMQLQRLGAAIGAHLDVGPLHMRGWEDAVDRLLRLAADRPLPVVLDEFGHIIEADPSVASLIASALGPGEGRERSARLVLCGSAIALMQSLTAGQAALRGRAGLELVMWADDYRMAATRLGADIDLDLAARVFAVIGGVVGYATDMVAFDLPDGPSDFDRWVTQRILSPAATLHHEASTLLAEDPTLAGGSQLHHHSILNAIGNGAGTAGDIAKRVGKPVPNLAPALNRLVATGFVVRHEDPIRARRPLYRLGDPYLQFSYALLEPNRALLRDRPVTEIWQDQMANTFHSQVRGPVFEEQARAFVRRHAAPSTIGGQAFHVGPSAVVRGGVAYEVDVIVAGEGSLPADRPITAIGEAKAGQQMDVHHLRRLRELRASLGARAVEARLLLFANSFDAELSSAARTAGDVELIDHQRLYHGF